MTPVKRRRPDGVHEAIARALGEIEARTGEQGIAAAAATLGCSQSLLYKASDPDMEGVELSLLRAGILTEVYGIRSMAEWLAGKAGCDLVEREPAEAPDFSATFEAIGAVVQDLADRKLTADEAPDLRRLIDQLHGLLGSLDDRGARIMPLKPGVRS